MLAASGLSRGADAHTLRATGQLHVQHLIQTLGRIHSFVLLPRCCPHWARYPVLRCAAGWCGAGSPSLGAGPAARGLGGWERRHAARSLLHSLPLLHVEQAAVPQPQPRQRRRAVVGNLLRVQRCANDQSASDATSDAASDAASDATSDATYGVTSGATHNASAPRKNAPFEWRASAS